MASTVAFLHALVAGYCGHAQDLELGRVESQNQRHAVVGGGHDEVGVEDDLMTRGLRREGARRREGEQGAENQAGFHGETIL